MAKQTHEVFIDDIDGTEGAQTVQFGFGGQDYEIEIGQAHLDQLTEALAPFIEHGRKVRRARAAGRSTQPKDTPSAKAGATAVREWAAAEGLEVNPRGRIPGEILAAYDEAH